MKRPAFVTDGMIEACDALCRRGVSPHSMIPLLQWTFYLSKAQTYELVGYWWSVTTPSGRAR